MKRVGVGHQCTFYFEQTFDIDTQQYWFKSTNITIFYIIFYNLPFIKELGLRFMKLL